MLKEIEMRRSIRKYIDKQAENEKITELLESARLAPSGNNTQPWHYIVVKSEEIRPVINIPHDKYVVGVITVGYPDETPKARPREKIEDIVHYELW
jgi:nitroreductase